MYIVVVRNNSNPKATDASLLLATYFATQGIEYVLVDSVCLSKPSGVEVFEEARSRGVDLVVVLGGDGTILRTARLVSTSGAPILGINFGRLGFLANSSEDGVVAIVASALAGDVLRERRANLSIDVVCEGDSDPFSDECFDDEAQQTSRRTFFALNEAALTRGEMGRIVDFSLSVSGSHVADMRGDGMVVATATGSTAYALSAGGPLVSPGFMGLVAVPLAPHTLRSRAMLTGDCDVVEIDVSANERDREVTLFIDGELMKFDKPIQKVYVRRGEEPTVLLNYQREDFYQLVSRTFF